MQKKNVYIDELQLIGPEKKYKSNLCCCFFSSTKEYEDIIQYLHTQERKYFDTLKFEKRIRSFLIGRLVAKHAVAALTGELDLADIYIQAGIFNQPIVVSNNKNIQVSITHSGDCGVALAFPETSPMGIDIEIVCPANSRVIERQMAQGEIEQIDALVLSRDKGLTLLWTAKEALSKILKTGLTIPLDIFEISKIEICDNCVMGYFKNFAQYKVISFVVDNYVCSIAYPFNTDIQFDKDCFYKVLNYYSILQQQ
jgi:phosphopantetheinyl transferase